MPNNKQTHETKEQFETRYGQWLQDMRLEINKSLQDVATAVDISVSKLEQYENGKDILLYDAIKLCDYYGVDD